MYLILHLKCVSSKRAKEDIGLYVYSLYATISSIAFLGLAAGDSAGTPTVSKATTFLSCGILSIFFDFVFVESANPASAQL